MAKVVPLSSMKSPSTGGDNRPKPPFPASIETNRQGRNSRSKAEGKEGFAGSTERHEKFPTSNLANRKSDTSENLDRRDEKNKPGISNSHSLCSDTVGTSTVSSGDTSSSTCNKLSEGDADGGRATTTTVTVVSPMERKISDPLSPETPVVTEIGTNSMQGIAAVSYTHLTLPTKA